MTLVKNIKESIARDGLLAADRRGEPVSHEMQLAVAVLMLRAAYSDKRFAPEERKEALQDLSREFQMDARDVKLLIEEARGLQSFDAWIGAYIERIRKSFDVDQRIEILSLVCRMTEADGLVDSTEETFIDSLQLKLGLSNEEAAEAARRAEAD